MTLTFAKVKVEFLYLMTILTSVGIYGNSSVLYISSTV